MCNSIIIAVSLLISIQVNYLFALRVNPPQCNQPLHIYSNIGCKPKYSTDASGGQKVCPDCFDCSHIDSTLNKCFYRGKYYNISEGIESTAELPNCIYDPICNKYLTFTTRSDVACLFPLLQDDEYYAYGLNDCCPNIRKKNENTIICQANNEEIYEGNIFENPKDQCSICECNSDVTGYPGDPHCKKTLCDIEIFHATYIQSFCAPLYLTTADCCPYEYFCPRENDVFQTSCGTSSCANDTGLVKCNDKEACNQCRYGKQCYEKGSRFSRKQRKNWIEKGWYMDTTCECVIPPYFTCISHMPIS